MLLEGRSVVLTGATGGIGRHLAAGIAEQGADLVVHYHQAEQHAEALLERIRERGRRAIAVRADLTEAVQAEALVAAAVAAFGRCDVLINNAGAAQRKPLREVTPDLWRRAFAVNVDSTFFCTQAAARQMIRQRAGKIINMGSIVADLASVLLVPYSAAKAAVHMLTKATAVALAPYGITVNAIAPGVVTTEKMRARLQIPGNLPPILARTPTGTLVAPEDLVGVTVFLASALADHITGQIITVDHGYTLEGLEWQPDA